MKTHRLLSLLILIEILAVGCSQKTSTPVLPPQNFIQSKNPENAGFYNNRLAWIDSLILTYIKDGTLPNAVTFVAHKGEVVHHKAYGMRNLEERIPLKEDDIFRIASQTKAITSVALMTLFEEGKFLLDDPVSKYIPEFKNPMVMETFSDKDTSYTVRPAKREITIRHLLSHTSGIHYGILGGGPGNMIFSKEGIPAVNSLDPITIKEISGKIASLPLLFDPGDEYYYGMNIDIAGYLIEVISGQSFDAFLKERIFDPLGMNDTYFYLPEEKEERLVSLYSSSSEGLVYHKNVTYQTYPVAGAKTFLSGGAGLCGSIEDYARFCQMLLNGGIFNGNRIISRNTIELMTSNQIGEKTIRGGSKFGLGFELFGEAGASNHLVSESAFRWGGMHYTDYVIDPEEELIMLFYTNVQPFRGPDIHKTMRNLVYQAKK
jgi:CubicO group peptidase (beta-lactamase class C family)